MGISDNVALKGTGTYYTVVEDPTAQDAVLNLSDHHFEVTDADAKRDQELARKKIRKASRHIFFETIVCIGLILLVGCFVLLLIFPQMELSEMARDNSDLKDEISVLRKNIMDSEEDINGITDMDTLRAQALALGMQDPNANQVVTIPMPNGDKLTTVVIYDEYGISEEAYDHAITNLEDYYMGNPN